MRYLVLLRGAPGSGKSTFVKERKLEQYTLCPDDIRLLFQSPIMLSNGSYGISQQNDKKVWSFLFELLEQRMKRGEFTLIDATHSKSSDFKKYKKLASEYRYRVYCVDFSDIPIEVTKKQNKTRLSTDPCKYVPEEVIDKMYARFSIMDPQGFITIIKPQEFEKVFKYRLLNLSHYKKIHHVGDIHGCYTALMEYFEKILELEDKKSEEKIVKEIESRTDEMFIFLGDYTDRGIENDKVMNFILKIYNLKNTMFILSNHDRHLWDWASGQGIVSREFAENTQKQLESAEVNKKEIRNFYRKICQLAYYTYHDKVVLVTHGGLSALPENLIYIATEQFVKGVGRYEDDVDKAFMENTTQFDLMTYQIHGHRNIQTAPTHSYERTFNLEGQVEFGGCLRAVTLTEKGFKIYEVKNDIFKKQENIYLSSNVKTETINAPTIEEDIGTISKIVESLRANKGIFERRFGNISAFNFKSHVFRTKEWDSQTIKARGLFINTATNQIVSRSYNKFFNLNELEETKLANLKNILEFPVNIYQKENGFLGIIGYDSLIDSLVVSSKGSLRGEFQQNFDRILRSKLSEEKLIELKDFIKNKGVSFVFEVIDPVKDPHIIKYQKEELYLLDIIYRTPEYKKLHYTEVKELGKRFGLKVKENPHTFHSWNELLKWYQATISDDEASFASEDHVEGYVLEDSKGFMVKIKLPFYFFWKFMRSIKEKVKKETYFDPSILYNALANNFWGFLKELKENSPEELEKDIIYLREKFVKGG